MSFDVTLFSARPMHAGLDLLSPLKQVLESEWFVLGKQVNAFETEFAEYCGVSHCVSLANGTDALELALKAVGVEAGDSVWMAANAGFYGSTAARAFGAVPFYVDVDDATLVISVEQLRKANGPKPKAIIVTHLYGQLADMAAVMSWAKEHGVPVIEDCAQAHGASRAGRRAGSWGDISCFSFYPTKNLGALGDGGAICTSDAALAERVRQLRTYGWSTKYHNDLSGGRNSRLDEMQAALLRVKLPALDGWNNARRAIAKQYCEALKGVQLPASTGDDHVAHLFVIRTERRDSLKEFLTARKIQSDVHYPVADHKQKVSRAAKEPEHLSTTETACSKVLTLPCYPGLDTASVSRVIEAVNEWARS